MPLISGFPYTVVSLGNTMQEAHGGSVFVAYKSWPPGEQFVQYWGTYENAPAPFYGFNLFGYLGYDWQNNPTAMINYLDAFAGSWVGMWQRDTLRSYAGNYQYGSAIVYMLLPAQRVLGLLSDEVDLQRIYMMQAFYYVYPDPSLTYCNTPTFIRQAFSPSRYSNFRYQVRYAGMKQYGTKLPWLTPSQLSTLPLVADIPVTEGATWLTIGSAADKYTEIGKIMALPAIPNSPGKVAFESDVATLLAAPQEDALTTVFAFVLHTDLQALGAELPSGTKHAYTHLIGWPGRTRNAYLYDTVPGCTIKRGVGHLPYALFPGFVFVDSPRRGMRLYAGIQWELKSVNATVLGQATTVPIPESYPVGIKVKLQQNALANSYYRAYSIARYEADIVGGGRFSKLDTGYSPGSFLIPRWKQVVPGTQKPWTQLADSVTVIATPEMPIAGRYNGILPSYNPFMRVPDSSYMQQGSAYIYGWLSYSAFPLAGNEQYPSSLPYDYLHTSISISGVTNIPPLARVAMGANLGLDSITITRTDFLLVW